MFSGEKQLSLWKGCLLLVCVCVCVCVLKTLNENHALLSLNTTTTTAVYFRGPPWMPYSHQLTGGMVHLSWWVHGWKEKLLGHSGLKTEGNSQVSVSP